MVGANTFQDLNLTGSPDFQTTAVAVDTEDIGSVLSKKEDYQRELEDNFSRDLAKTYNDLSGDNKKYVDAIEKQVIKDHNLQMQKDPSLKPLTDMQLHREVVDIVSHGDNSALSLQDKIRLKSQMDEIDSLNRAKSEAFQKAEDVMFAQGAEEIYEELTTNPDIVMHTSGKSSITFNDFLKQENIKSKEDLVSFLSSNTDKAKVFKANFLMQTYGNLNGIGQNLRPELQVYTEGVGPVTIVADRDLLRRLKRSQELMGDNRSLDEIFELTNGVGDVIELENLNEDQLGYIRLKDTNSDFGRFVQNLSETRATAGIFSGDKSLRQESHIYKLFSQDKFTEEYERALNLSTANITGQNIITIEPSGTRIGENVPQYEYLKTKANPRSIVGLDTKLPINLRKNTDGTYTMFQNQPGEDGNVEIVQGVLTRDDITSSEFLSRSILLDENKSKIDFNTQVRSEVPTLNYTKSSAKNSAELRSVFDPTTLQGQNKIMMSSKDSVIQYLGSTLPGMNRKQKSADYVTMVNKVINNPNKFSLKMDSYEGVSNIVVEMEDTDGKKVEINSIDVGSGIDQTEFMNIYYAAPQIFLTLALQNIGSDYMTTNDVSKIDLINKNL